MIRREDDGFWLEFSEPVPVHHENVFAALTSEQITLWFPVSVELDLRTGGTLVLGWDEKMTRKTTVAILEYDPGGAVTWDWEVGSAGRHAPVYWRVEPSVENGSIVHFRQGPFPNETDAMVELANEATSWRWYVCNLRSVLEAKHDMRKVRPL